MKYTKYKKSYRISCFGNNDDWRNKADSQYRTIGSSFIMVKYVDLVLMVLLMM